MSTGSSFNPQHEISDRVCSKPLGETTAAPSIPHPNREQALTRARLTAGFANVVNGQRIDSSRLIKISDPVTGEELASVTDTQKAGLHQAVQAAKAAFPHWSSKTWNERRELLASAVEVRKAHTDELCTILTAENGRPYRILRGTKPVSGRSRNVMFHWGLSPRSVRGIFRSCCHSQKCCQLCWPATPLS